MTVEVKAASGYLMKSGVGASSEPNGKTAKLVSIGQS